MSNLSEYALFKQAVDHPIRLDSQFSQLNLQFVHDPASNTQNTFKDTSAEFDDGLANDPEAAKRKALRLMHNIWSGVTKCLRNIVQQQRKAIEIPNFAIFGPLLEQLGYMRDPLDKGHHYKHREMTAGKAYAGSIISPVLAVLDSNFIAGLNGNLTVDQSSDKAVGQYNRNDKKDVIELFSN